MTASRQLPIAPIGCPVEGSGISLRDYFEVRMDAMEAASTLHREALDRRLGIMNEFREALRDQVATSLPRQEWDITHSRVKEDIQALRESRAALEGKASQASVTWATLLAVSGLICSVITAAYHFMRAVHP